MPGHRRTDKPSRSRAHAAPGQSFSEYRSCVRKKRYATKVEAQKAAKAGSRKRDAPALYVYQCPDCGGWHLTHRKPR